MAPAQQWGCDTMFYRRNDSGVLVLDTIVRLHCDEIYVQLFIETN